MTITMRPWRDETDLPLIVDLLRNVPPTSHHLIDTPSIFRKGRWVTEPGL